MVDPGAVPWSGPEQFLNQWLEHQGADRDASGKFVIVDGAVIVFGGEAIVPPTSRFQKAGVLYPLARSLPQRPAH